MDNEITKKKLLDDLSKLDIQKGELLHLKVSLKSIGNVKGGAKTVLDALLETVGKEGTLVIDSFIKSYPLPLSEENKSKIPNSLTPSYAGALANEMIKHPDMVRSLHPLQKFTAIGKYAKELMHNHTADSFAYAPLEKMCEMGAKNLTIGSKTIGVGTTHVAIEKMGFKSKQPSRGINYIDENDQVQLFKVNWHGGCAKGFPKFIPLYLKEGAAVSCKIGNADSLFTDMKKTLQIEIEKLKSDPTFFFCDDPTCKGCRLWWEHSTGNYLSVKFWSALKIIKDRIK